MCQPSPTEQKNEKKRNFYLIVLFNPQNHFVVEMENFRRGTDRSADIIRTSKAID